MVPQPPSAVLADKSNAVGDTEGTKVLVGVKCTPDGEVEERVAPTQGTPAKDVSEALCADEALDAPTTSTPELPDSLREWKDYANTELSQLNVFKKQGLLDWPLVKGAINCCVVSCPVKSLRAEIRALRDNGVYGSSMVPYLTVMTNIIDSADQCAEDAEEDPVEFSESDDDSDDSDDDESTSGSDGSNSSEEESTQEEAREETHKNKRARVEGIEMAASNGDTKKKKTVTSDDDDARPVTTSKPKHPKPPKYTEAGSKKHLKGSSAPSAYQLEMRVKYKEFSRFLGSLFAKEHLESAPVASLVNHPDAKSFADTEIVAFLDMLQRENKVMLHEGTVMII